MNDVTAEVFGNYPYKAGETFHIYLISDLHLGAEATDEKRIIKELDHAVKKNARININGDVFDGILPKDYLRYMPATIRKSLRGRDDLINATIDYGYNFILPYAKNIDVIGEGNHENAIRKHHNVDMLKLLIARLNQNEGVNIKQGGYCGFIVYRFCANVKRTGGTERYVIYYKHGTSSRAPVTKGVIDFNREAEVIDGADVIWLAHNHEVNNLSATVMSVNSHGTVKFRKRRYVRTGGYFFYTMDSYAQAKGLRPLPHGGAMIKLNFTSTHKERIIEAKIEQ